MTTTTEQVLSALADRLRTIPDVSVERNAALPERIPVAGLLILRDGDPGEPDRALGGFETVYYSHAAALELYAEGGNAAMRDADFDALLASVGAALAADPTLGGLVFGMRYGRPEVATDPVPGAAAIKTGTMPIVLEFEAPSPLG